MTDADDGSAALTWFSIAGRQWRALCTVDHQRMTIIECRPCHDETVTRVDFCASSGRRPAPEGPARPTLSEREVEVLIAWMHTESKAGVGRELFIAPCTVSTHLERIRAKYAAVGRPARTKAALTARAIQDGLVSLDDL